MADNVVRHLWQFLRDNPERKGVPIENIAAECRTTVPAIRKAFLVLEEIGLIRIYHDED